ncbi:alkaline phosphatase PafA [Croceitalea marina]|uniref:Alkaline phosphatase PafA n=1 Tax=Croceitalea marina TaxID=1775166 RepID=A0ABW5N0R8_9FLAO
MIKKDIFCILTLFFSVSCFSQSRTFENPPKLIVGIVIDQLRFDHLYKYQDKYSEGGIKRLITNGYNFKNTHYNYVPTETAPGHASIYTGTTPSINGIIGNSWYDRFTKVEVGNVKDSTTIIIGSDQPNSNGISPKNLLTTTISDELRMSNQFRSKVISISLKDRGAVLPGGYTANASYWHDWQTSSGNFVSSSYYMDVLPKWVKDFNKQKKSDRYLNNTWNTLFPIESYTESAPDDNDFERILQGNKKPVFPYDFKELRKIYKSLGREYILMWLSPFGNTILTEFAKEAIKHERLGEDKHTDLLNISYSVLDVLGHTVGPQSVEFQDAYLRLDRNIESLLSFLDTQIGLENYIVFLTSDHGSVPTSSYLEKHNLKTGISRVNEYEDKLSKFLIKKYGQDKWIQEFGYENIYLDRDKIIDANLNLIDFQTTVANFLYDQKGVSTVLTAQQLRVNEYKNGVASMLQKGYNPRRSGDVVMTFSSGFKPSKDPKLNANGVKGTTHGSAFTYDTHVPLLWYGKHIKSGSSTRKIAIEDIAPTLSMLLNIRLPSGATGSPLQELLSDQG